MKEVKIIHLLWKEFNWDDTELTKIEMGKKHGIYQIYGDHPIYGKDTLLYIGKTKKGTYLKRLFNHQDFIDTHLTKFTKVHLSNFLKNNDVKSKNLDEHIDLVEKLLINSHCPAYNSSGIKGVMNEETFKQELLILNWGERGQLLPEVSSLRYSYHYWNAEVIDFEKSIL